MEKMPSRRPWRYLISALLMPLILWPTFHFLARGTSMAAIKQVLRTARLDFVFLGFALMLVHQLCVAQSLKIMCAEMLDHPLSFWACLKTAFIGFYFNNITPSASGGQPMEIYYMHRLGVRVAGSSSIFVAMGMLYNLCMLLFGITAFLLVPQLVLEGLGDYRWLFPVGLLLNGGMLLFFLWLLLKPQSLARSLAACIRGLARWKLVKDPEKTQEKLAGFMDSYAHDSLRLWESPGLFFRLLLWHALQLLAYYLVPYAAILALGGSPKLFGPSLALQSVLHLSISGMPTPGAVGVSEGGFATVFKALMPGKALPSMLLTRLINLYAFLIISALMSAFAFFRAPQNRKDSSA